MIGPPIGLSPIIQPFGGASGGGGAPVTPVVQVYTDLATLLAASGSAGDFALLQTAGGANVGVWLYYATLGWMPLDVDVTAAGANTAIGAAKIVTLAGSAPSFSSGFAVNEGDEASLRLWLSLSAALIGSMSVVTQASITGPGTATAGMGVRSMVGFESDAPSSVGPAGVYTESAGVYQLAVGRYYGAPGALKAVSTVNLGAVALDGHHGALSYRHKDVTFAEVAYNGAVSLGGVSDAAGGGVTRANTGTAAADDVDGLHFGLENSGTAASLVMTLQRARFIFEEV